MYAWGQGLSWSEGNHPHHPPPPHPPGSTTESASGTSRANSSAAAAAHPNAGTRAQPWPSGWPALHRRPRTACRTPAVRLPATRYEAAGQPASLQAPFREDVGVLAGARAQLPGGSEARPRVPSWWSTGGGDISTVFAGASRTPHHLSHVCLVVASHCNVAHFFSGLWHPLLQPGLCVAPAGTIPSVRVRAGGLLGTGGPALAWPVWRTPASPGEFHTTCYDGESTDLFSIITEHY